LPAIGGVSNEAQWPLDPAGIQQWGIPLRMAGFGPAETEGQQHGPNWANN